MIRIFARHLALTVRPIRRLYDERNDLRMRAQELESELARLRAEIEAKLKGDPTSACAVPIQPIPSSLPAVLPTAVDKVTTQSEYEALLSTPIWQARSQLETYVAATHQGRETFELSGYSILAGQGVHFEVQYPTVSLPKDGVNLPIWRETLVCPVTLINNRRRAVLTLMRHHLSRLPLQPKPVVYLFEQVTNVFRYAREYSPEAEVIGSEWLGADIPGGTMINGICHEDCAKLSLDTASVDIVISLDVFEHVPDPDVGFLEKARILKRGGTLLMTIPFYSNRAQSTQRARLVYGKLEHLLTPEYHGSPIDPNGSLVYSDFGWDVIDRIRQAGFRDVHIQAWWSLEYGHLGHDNLIFVGTRN